MGQLLQIRNVPEESRRVLKARAAERGQSLNTHVLGLLGREASRPTLQEVLERAAAREERAQVSALDILLAGRTEREATSVDRTPR